MKLGYCILHKNWYPIEQDAWGHEGHVYTWGSPYLPEDEPGIDWCDFPLTTSEPPTISEEEWDELLYNDEFWYDLPWEKDLVYV